MAGETKREEVCFTHRKRDRCKKLWEESWGEPTLATRLIGVLQDWLEEQILLPDWSKKALKEAMSGSKQWVSEACAVFLIFGPGNRESWRACGRGQGLVGQAWQSLLGRSCLMRVGTSNSSCISLGPEYCLPFSSFFTSLPENSLILS